MTAVRVLFINPTAQLGGAEYSLLDLAGTLDRERFIPMIACLGDGPLVGAAAERGIDVATAALYEQLRREGRLFSAASVGNPSPVEDSSDSARGATLAIVPGAFYREHPQTGADGAPPIAAARSLGCGAPGSRATTGS